MHDIFTLMDRDVLGLMCLLVNVLQMYLKYACKYTNNGIHIGAASACKRNVYKPVFSLKKCKVVLYYCFILFYKITGL